jgi:hypothetical protein
MKLLDEMTQRELPSRPLAYFNPQWRRDSAPLLDELAASVDHVHAYSKGGAHDISNFATICARCNARKAALSVEEHTRRNPAWKVKGKHGERRSGMDSRLCSSYWRDSHRALTLSERKWLVALERHWAAEQRI